MIFTCIIDSLTCTMFLQKKSVCVCVCVGGGLCYYTVVKQFKNILVKTRVSWESALVQRQALSQNWKGKVEGTPQFKWMILNDIGDTCSHRNFKCFRRMWSTAALLWKPQNLQFAVKFCISLLETVRNKDLNMLNCNHHGTDHVTFIECTSESSLYLQATRWLQLKRPLCLWCGDMSVLFSCCVSHGVGLATRS